MPSQNIFLKEIMANVRSSNELLNVMRTDISRIEEHLRSINGRISQHDQKIQKLESESVDNGKRIDRVYAIATGISLAIGAIVSWINKLR